MIIRLLAAILLLSSGAFAQLNQDQLARVDHIEHRLKPPCCWQGSLADHRSEIALQMKDEIQQMVVDGRTDREILDRYKAEYGQRVLVEPEGGLFVVMNVVPVIVLILGLVTAVLVLRKWLQPVPAKLA